MMSIYFYLSHARADNSEYVGRFFEDLSDTIRVRLGLPRDQKIGFFDRRETRIGPQWDGRLAEALQTGRTMVSLLSPSYFRSEQTGKEWQVFEIRKQLSANLIEAGQAIIPLIWVPWQEPPPELISESQYFRFNQYNKEGLLAMLKSSNRRQYSQFVIALAEQIIETSEGPGDLPPLPVLPDPNDVKSAFQFKEEQTPRSHSAADQVNKYKALVIDDDQQVRDLLVECLRFSGFAALGYGEAERVLLEVFADPSQENMPDLFVVDLQLEAGRMQGIDLINEITDRNAPANIVAISGNEPSSQLVEAIKIGAATAVTKPFENIFQLMEKMKKLASIGMRRRLYNLSDFCSGESDSSRYHRPVFLSYSSEDKRAATGLRSQIEAQDIGVWYAPDTLQPGDPWRAHVERGIDQARVFVALVTESYLSSRFCLAELTRFHHRLEVEVNDPPSLLPVVYDSTKAIRAHAIIKPIFDKYQYVDISSERFIDGLTVLLARIQTVVGPGFGSTSNRSQRRVPP